jgi:hypothetical protein
MGFIVKHPVQTSDEKQYDEFYVRIENYQLNKVNGYIGVSVAHYETPEAAKNSIPDYLEDEPDGSGRINVAMTHDPSVVDDEGNIIYPIWNMWYTYPLTEKVVVQEEIKTSSWAPRTVEYVDFDEEGNEVIKTKEEWFETITTTYQDVEKTKKNLSLIDGDPFGYAYAQLKQSYGEIFGSENITDEI